MSRALETYPIAFPAARFRALDGAAELAVAEAAGSGLPRPVRMTAVLAAVFAEIAGEACAPTVLRRISSAGREWLLHRAARRFYHFGPWFESVCSHCSTPFDLQIPFEHLPRIEAGPTFPVVVVETSLGSRRFEAPNGGHEEVLSRAGGAADSRRAFVALCGTSDQAQADAMRFNDADLESIDAALERASPDIADSVDSVCPTCSAEITAKIDPLDFAFPQFGSVITDIHLLAQAYHWSEEEILALPIHRRCAYVDLVRENMGAQMVTHVSGRTQERLM